MADRAREPALTAGQLRQLVARFKLAEDEVRQPELRALRAA